MSTNNIYQAINAIMKEVPAIGKDRKNIQQGYNFRGIDDIYNALNEHLAKHGVFATSEVLSHEREERQTARGGTLIYSIITVKFNFYAIDGSSVSMTMIGEGMDSGDKASNKAMSTAYKYAMMQLFCIPTNDAKDTEADHYEVLPKPSADRAVQAKPAPADDKPWLDAVDKKGNLTEKGFEVVKYLSENAGKTITDIRKKYKVSKTDEEAITKALADVPKLITKPLEEVANA